MNVFFEEDGRLRSGWRFVLSVIVVLLANFVAGTVAFGIAGRHQRVLETVFRPLLMLLEFAGFFLLTELIDRPNQGFWRYNGLQRENWLRETATGALLGFVMIGVAIVVIALFFHLSIVSLRINSRTFLTSIVVFGVILAAAMAEELAFRGYPFQRLVEGMGPIGAILVLSALFGAVHLQNPHISDNRWVQIAAFSNTLLIGIVLALGYLRTKALWFPFGLHFAWNAALGIFFGLPVSGISDFSIVVRSRASGPEWFLGGAYGLEGGFLGTIVILLGMAYVLIFVHPSATTVEIPEKPVDELLPSSIQSSGETSTEI